MNVKLKICGMRDPENIREVGALKPDYMGFIFYKDSPRYVTDHFVMPDLLASIQKVAVFVNEKPDAMQKIVEKYRFDFVQLHGDESVEECKYLNQKEIRIIKAFSVHDQFDFQVTEKYQSVADYFLFDTKGKYYGGNSKTFEWKLLEKYNQQIPFFLSGGLAMDNIQHIETCKRMNIHALDLNSGVEVSPGLKKASAIKNIQDMLNSQLLNPGS